MLDLVFTIINFSVLLLFGNYVSAAFLDIELTKKNNTILILFSAAVFSLQALSFFYFGMARAEMFYPLITHLPVFLLFVLCFKKRVLPSLFAIASAYLYCQIIKWFGFLIYSFTQGYWLMYAVRILVTVPIWYIIIRYAVKSLIVILSKSTRTILIFGILPFTYYLFDYIVTVYTNLLYSGSKVVFEFLPFLLCVAYLLFSMIYFKEYEEKCEAEHQKKLIEIRTAQSMKEIEEIRRSKYEISLIRHDMRHFLNNILVMVENEDYGKARDYIRNIIAAADQTALRKFCENETVNLILSSYESRMKERNVRLDADVAIPAVLPCSELAFTSILSNGLENAMNAVSGLDCNQRTVSLKLDVKNGKLLLSIRNCCQTPPAFKAGLPVASQVGHGLGTKSIQYIVEKLNGSCQFTAENGMFTLRVVV